MEQLDLSGERQKYLLRFVAVFLAKSRDKAISCRIDFTKAAAIIQSVVKLKTGYTPDLTDLYKCFVSLRYSIVGTEAPNDITFPLHKKIYLNIDLSKLEALARLQKYISCPATPKADQNLEELNLQIEILNKLYHKKLQAA
jgi:hypothetical protein